MEGRGTGVPKKDQKRMGLNVAIDTNVFIGVKNKDSSYSFSKVVLDWIDEGRVKGIVSTVVIAEMCAGYYETKELREKDDFLAHLLSSPNYEVVEVSAGVADEAGRIRAVTGLRLPDALVVASGLKRRGKHLVSNDVSLKRANEFINVLTPREFVEELQAQKGQGA